MPKYRQLRTKIVDSFDFAEMPNDFTRVFWLLLIVIVDSEGRGIDNPTWLRSRMFPLRQDVEDESIVIAMGWLAARGMIRAYEVDGHGYFEIVKWKEHQTGTEKEAKSILPPCPAPLPTCSEPTPDLLRVNTIQCNADSDTKADSDSAVAEKSELAERSTAHASLPTENLNTLWDKVARYVTSDPHFPKQTAERLFGCRVVKWDEAERVFVVSSQDANWLSGHMTSTIEKALPAFMVGGARVEFVEAA